MTKRILYIPFDHLNLKFGVLKDADPKMDHIVLIESARMTSGRPWHKERLFFLISSARHFAKELELAGFEVTYLKCPTTIDGLKQIQKSLGKLPIHAAEPSSFRQFNQLQEFGVQYVPNDFFLTSRTDFKIWADKQKSFLLETFYRAQRIRLNIMVENGKPDTGVWNFDKDNRLPPPKNYTWPKHVEHERDEIDLEVCAELGMEPTKTWATTRAGALAQLDHFINTRWSV
jgi:deoxyribodipyrimidine photolyase-related protein